MIYSTEGVHPRERLSYWREVATRGYVEHDVQLVDSSSFSGTIEIASLPGLVLANYDADAATVRRSEKYAARADCDDLLLGLHLEGEVAISQDGRDSIINERNFYLLDPLREFEVSLKGRNKNLVVKIPRTQLEARLGQLGDLTARPIAPGNPVSTLAMGFVEMLPQQSKTLDAIASLNIAEQALDLIALALSTHQRVEGASLSSPRAIALLRLKATVERLLIEPGLKPERIATEAGISVRYANSVHRALHQRASPSALPSRTRRLPAGPPQHRRDRIQVGLFRPLPLQPALQDALWHVPQRLSTGGSPVKGPGDAPPAIDTPAQLR